MSVRPSGCRRCLHEFLGGHSDPPLESGIGGIEQSDGERVVPRQKLEDEVHPCRAVINGADEWGLCAGLIQELDVDVATYALLQG
ncbi:hypothetical protein L3X38_003152 [Prunus dulcis]|uniref:Uncharacterized protein n=1 Tax=Prunus dulcis TaxID=3755 RepID=A0AAD4ZLI4_PRUDU|nr:hypothetical protein L3X38_003152 [Prunus dulcis]